MTLQEKLTAILKENTIEAILDTLSRIAELQYSETYFTDTDLGKDWRIIALQLKAFAARKRVIRVSRRGGIV